MNLLTIKLYQKVFPDQILNNTVFMQPKVKWVNFRIISSLRGTFGLWMSSRKVKSMATCSLHVIIIYQRKNTTM